MAFLVCLINFFSSISLLHAVVWGRVVGSCTMDRHRTAYANDGKGEAKKDEPWMTTSVLLLHSSSPRLHPDLNAAFHSSLRICELRSLVSFLSWSMVNDNWNLDGCFRVSLLPSGHGTVCISLTIKLQPASWYPSEMLFYSSRSLFLSLAIPFCFTSWLSRSNSSHPSHGESAIESWLKRSTPHSPT